MTPNQILNEAIQAGKLAMRQATPTPMVVQTHKNMADDNSPIVKSEIIYGGVCGFAWIHIDPARGKFVTFLKKNNIGHKGYYGGYEIGVKAGGQSMELKRAYASGFAKVLVKYGIHAYSDSRMD